MAWVVWAEAVGVVKVVGVGVGLRRFVSALGRGGHAAEV